METKPRAWVRENHRSKQESRHPSKKVWEVVYTDPDTHNRRTKGGFRTKGAAQEWADSLINEVREGRWVDPARGTITFAEVAKLWFKDQPFARLNTETGYRRIIEGDNDLTRAFNDVAIGDITYGAVLSYIKSSTKGAQTIRHRFYVLRSVLDYALNNRLIPSNPARLVNPKVLPSPKRMRDHEENRHPLTLAETERIIAAMPAPYDVFTRLVAYTGMRPEEAAALTLDDVDLNDGTVRVRSVLIESKDGTTREPFTKSDAGKRTVDLDSRTLAVLAVYITEHRRRAAQWFATNADHAHYGADEGEALPLFVGCVVGGRTSDPVLDRLDYSKPFRYSSFNKRHWHKALKAAGVPTSVRFYDLRHAEVSRFVSRMGKADEFALKEIQERYGHKSAHMTLDRYAHPKKPDRSARRREIDAAIAAELSRDAINVTPISANKRIG